MQPVTGFPLEVTAVHAVILFQVPELDPVVLHQDGGLLQLSIQGVAVIRVTWKGPGSHDQVAFEGGGNAHLDPELVGLSAFALANALDLRGVKGVELAFALTILLGCGLRPDAFRPLQGGLQGLPGRFGADCVNELALDRELRNHCRASP